MGKGKGKRGEKRCFREGLIVLFFFSFVGRVGGGGKNRG